MIFYKYWLTISYLLYQIDYRQFQEQENMSCPECLKTEKKIRILQSDHQFELRKLSEDKSTQKALYEINVQKEIRKWQQKYHKEKQDHEQNGKKWLNKIDSVTEQCNAKVIQIQRTHDTSLLREKHRLQIELQQYKQVAEKNHNHKINVLVQKQRIQLAEKENMYANQLNRIKKEQFLELERLKQLFGDKQNRIKNQYESHILGLKSQKHAEEKSHFKLEDEFKKQKNLFINQIYDLKGKINNLEADMRQLNRIIMLKEQQIAFNLEQISHLKVRYAEQTIQLNTKHQKELSDMSQRTDSIICQFYQNQLKLTEKYQKTILRIEENRQIELRLYENNMNQIKNCVESRPSRVEDVQEIITLRDKLNKRDKQFEVLQRQLKNYQLQLQNKEDTYNKIFIPTVNSTHLSGEQNIIKRKELRMKRPAGRSVSTVRQILHNVNINSNNLPLLNNIDKKFLPPKSTKIL